MASKHCPAKDIRELKWVYTLPEFLKVTEYVEIMEAMEKAVTEDEETKQNSSSKGKD
jgi:hypothetical protein